MDKISREPLRHGFVNITGIVRLNGNEIEIYGEDGEYLGTVVDPLEERFRQREGRIVKFRAKEIPQYLVDWRGDSGKIFLRPHTPESPYPFLL